MKTVRFETVRELALALLDGRRFKAGDFELYFSESQGFIDDRKESCSAADLEDCLNFVDGMFYELPPPRHHAELIKAWAEDESLILEWLLGEGDSYESWNYAPVSGDFYIGTSYRLIDRLGNVIMVSEGKK